MTRRTLLIDPFEQKITPVNYENYTDWYSLMQCECFCLVPNLATINGRRVDIYVDDNGLFVPDQKYWLWAFYPHQPLAGRGVVTFTDDEGETIDFPEECDSYIHKWVRWVS